MKVAVISHAYVRPGHSSLLQAMASHAEISLITPASYRSGMDGRLLHFAAIEGLPSYPLAVRFGTRQGAFTYQQSDLERALAAIDPDVILHEQEIYALSATQVALTAARQSIPLVMFVWENLERSLVYPRRVMSRFVLRHCAGLVVGSQTAANVHRKWGFSGAIDVAPQMGISVNPQPAFGRRDPTMLRIAFAGRLVPEKGVDCLLHAVAELRSRGIAVECAIAGCGPERSMLESLASQLGIGSIVKFHAPMTVNEVRSLLGASDILVLPSRRTRVWQEQFGRVLTEAMAEATVAVGARTGAIPDVISEKELLFEEDDHHQLAAILERLSSDPTQFQILQERLWARARAHYTNDSLAINRIRFLERACLQRDGEASGRPVPSRHKAINMATGSMAEAPRLAILTNIASPYKLPIFDGIAQAFETSVYFSGIENNRNGWNPPRSVRFSWKYCWGITKSRTVQTSDGAYDRRYVHFNPGILWNLLRAAPDAVITNELGFRTASAMLYCALARKPLWVWWGGTLHTERKRDTFRRLFRRIISKRVRRWISYGESSTEYLVTGLSVPRERILQVQNCVPEDRFLQFGEATQPPKTPTVLCVSQLIGRKGLPQLLRVSAELLREGLQFNLIIHGDGADKERLASLAEELHIHNVTFRGTVPPKDMPGVYRSATCLVLPTLEDVWGLVVNEALWSGIPVISTPYAGCAAELLPGENIFDPNDMTRFKSVMKRAILGQLAPPSRSSLWPTSRVVETIVADVRSTLCSQRQWRRSESGVLAR